MIATEATKSSAKLKYYPYQQDCEDACRAALASATGNRSAIVNMATGGGKTFIFSQISGKSVNKGGKVLILAHRAELIRQAAETVQRVAGIFPSVEMADERASRNADIVIASVPSLQNARLHKFPSNHFDLIIVDEAHHSTASTYRNIIEHFPEAKVLGFTATASRTDKACLGDIYDEVAYEITTLELVRQGFLSPLVVKSVPVDIDLSALSGKKRGDYTDEEVGNIIKPHIDKAVKMIQEHASDRHTLVFFPTIETSKAFTRAANEAGLKCAHVDGKTPTNERESIVSDLKNSRINVVSNVMVFTEGTDIPIVDCILMMRPTKSHILLSQCVGRGLRLYEGKENCLLLDPLYLHESNDLMKPADLVANDESHRNAMKELSVEEKLEEASEAEYDLAELAHKAECHLEASLKRRLHEARNKEGVERSLEDLAVMFSDREICDFVPTCRWHKDKPTESQLEMLRKAGLSKAKLKEIDSKGLASKIIDNICKRQKDGKATIKQVRQLKRFGVEEEEANSQSFKQASLHLDKFFKKDNK